MRRCSKCQKIYDDDSRICRACGAIIDDVAAEALPAAAPTGSVDVLPSEKLADEPLSPVELADAVALLREAAGSEWMCPACGQPVPAEFEVCWNCDAAAIVGEPPAEPLSPPVGAGDVAGGDDATLLRTAERQSARRCRVCGSDHVVANVELLDQTGSFSLRVVVDGNPDALLFKNRHYGELTADVCGDCGHVDLRVRNPDELYQHALSSGAYRPRRS